MEVLDGLEARTRGLKYQRLIASVRVRNLGIDFGAASIARGVALVPLVDAAAARFRGASFTLEAREELRRLFGEHLRANGRRLDRRELSRCDLVLDVQRGLRRTARWIGEETPPRLEVAARDEVWRMPHRTARSIDGARASGFDVSDAARLLALTRGARRAGAALAHSLGTGALVAIAPSSRRRRSWGVGRFAGLASALADRMGGTTFQIGGPPVPGVERLPRHVPVESVAGLLRLCCVCVGDDDGWVHVAAALGTPSVAVHGPTCPEVTGPSSQYSASVCARCIAPPGVHRRRPGRCLRCLSVADVIPVAERLAAERWPWDRIDRWLA